MEDNKLNTSRDRTDSSEYEKIGNYGGQQYYECRGKQDSGHLHLSITTVVMGGHFR